MSVPIQIKTTVLPGHRIEVCDPTLPEGRLATIYVVLDEAPVEKRPLLEVIGNYTGGSLFQSADDVDAHLRAERDAWE